MDDIDFDYNHHNIDDTTDMYDKVRRCYTAEDIIQNHTTTILQQNTSLSNYTKEQLDALAYTYPYHAKNHVFMLPPDCIDHERNSNNFTDIEHHLHSFNVRHPLLQLRFNKHANEHRPSCF